MPHVRRPRRSAAALTSAVALASLALLAGVGFGIQALAFPRPSRAQLVSVQTLRWILQYPVVRGVVEVRGRRVTTLCADTWVRSRLGRKVKGEIVVLAGGERMLRVDYKLSVLSPAGEYRPGRVQVVQFELAGCPATLGQHLGEVLELRHPLRFVPLQVDGRPAYRLRFATETEREQIELLVARTTLLPFRIGITRDGVSGTSLIRQTKLTPALERRLERASEEHRG